MEVRSLPLEPHVPLRLTRLLSEPVRVRVPGGAPFDCPYRLEARTSAPQAEDAGAIPAWDTDLPDLPDAGIGLRSRLSRFDSSQGGRENFLSSILPSWRTQV